MTSDSRRKPARGADVRNDQNVVLAPGFSRPTLTPPPVLRVSESLSAEILGSAGPFRQVLPGFAERAEQQALAAAIEQTIDQDGCLIAEAGTGTGKTFAYLVPALLSGRKVIVSTGTKALQDQLFHRDLPRVREVLKLKNRAALLKGRANYLCHYRLAQTVSEGRLRSRDLVEDLSAVRSYAVKTRDGDITYCSEVKEDSQLWPLVTSTADNCLGQECPFYGECFVVKARRAAMEADIVVVNHHLLFADMAIKEEGFGEVLPGAQVFVLDEAHQLAEAATLFFGYTVSFRSLSELARDSRQEAAEAAGALALLRPPADALEQALKNARLELDALPERGSIGLIVERDEYRAALEPVSAGLAALAQTLAPLIDSSPGLSACHERADLAMKRLDTLIAASDEGMVFWYEKTRLGFSLTATPLDIAEPMARFRARIRSTWIFASATLAVGEDFSHFQRQLGLLDAATLKLDSPFDFPAQAMLYVPRGLPDPTAPAYVDAVIDAALPVIEANPGGTFFLFTSHRALKRAHERLKLESSRRLYVQGEAPKRYLLEEFQRDGHGVLLGAASFWEGVDVPGHALSLVIIDKLPFAAPDDPILEARLEALRRAGVNPFMQAQVPKAVLALKQGVGRLIRTIDDRGALMLCDPRLYGKPYGRVFLDSLPPMRISRSASDVTGFLAALDEPTE
jgi:ATP-dependent DNA helicase DinG